MDIKLRELDAVVFDMDGVIFDSERLGLRSWQAVADRHGLGDISETAKKCIGRNTADTMRIFDEAYGDRVSIEELYEEAKVLMRDIIAKEGLPLKEGARELLGFLKEQDIRVGLASSTKQAVVKDELTAAGLFGYFSVIVGGDMIKRSKPEPDIYLTAAKALDLASEQCIALEDSPNGIRSAYSAGCKAIMIPDLTQPDDEIKPMLYGCYASLSELCAQLDVLL